MENRKYLAYLIKTTNGDLRCKLTADDSFRFSCGAPCRYETETVVYAVCRYIRHSPELRDPLIREAVRLGLTIREKRKNKLQHVRTKAALLSLPGGDARITLSVRQGEIVVKELIIEAVKGGWSAVDLKLAHDFSSNHKPELEKDRVCGCFCCGSIFSPKKILNWIIADTPIDFRGTAVCPYCMVDSVIGESSGYPITPAFLRAMNEKWFGFMPLTLPEGEQEPGEENRPGEEIVSVCFDLREDPNMPSPLCVDAGEKSTELGR